MRLREAVPADAVHMAEVERLVAQHPWSLAQFLNSCRSQRESVWVLEGPGGDIAGFTVCQTVADEVSLLNIAVLPRYQGHKHGAELLRNVLRQARLAGATRCLLEVRRGNTRAIALYRAQGFSEDGVRRNYYPAEGGREDALLMSMNLAVTK